MVGTPGSIRSVLFGVLCAPKLEGGSGGLHPRKFLEKDSCLDAISCNLGYIFNDFRQGVFLLSWYLGSTSWPNMV